MNRSLNNILAPKSENEILESVNKLNTLERFANLFVFYFKKPSDLPISKENIVSIIKLVQSIIPDSNLIKIKIELLRPGTYFDSFYYKIYFKWDWPRIPENHKNYWVHFDDMIVEIFDDGIIQIT